VPVLVDGDHVLMQSFAIARHAERTGGGASLFPAGHEDEIAAWNDRSDVVMTAGRAMLLPRMRRSPAALREQLPPFVPATLRPAMQPVASMVVEHLVHKYDVHAGEHHESRSREALDALRERLADGREFLLGGSFSYADVTMAASLQFILPVDQRHIALGPATREVWTHPGLANEYADLIAWRDRLYSAHR
jgi:glutathione S-transferase